MHIIDKFLVGTAIGATISIFSNKIHLAHNLYKADAPIVSAVKEAAVYGPWFGDTRVSCFSLDDKKRAAAIATMFPLYRAGWKWQTPCIPESGRAIICIDRPGQEADVRFVSCEEAATLMAETRDAYVVSHAQKTEKMITLEWRDGRSMNCLTVERP